GSVFLSRLSSSYVLLVLASNAFLLVRSYFVVPNQAIKDRIKVIGIGIIMATSVIALWSLNFLLISESFYLDEGILLASVFSLFMAYAILRKNVFDLDHVIRQTLSYGVAGFVVLSLYLVVIGGIREWLLSATLAPYASWVFVLLMVL